MSQEASKTADLKADFIAGNLGIALLGNDGVTRSRWV
jgi:hypothetical protein